MVTRNDLKDMVLRAVQTNGGSATLTDIAKYIWTNHEKDLRHSGDLFYRWQYDMRWAANALRHEGKLAGVEATPRGTWALK
jgi:hypothetical protein